MEYWESLITTTIEVQIMRQFQQSQQFSMPYPCEYVAELASILGGQMFGTLSRDMLFVKPSLRKLYSGATLYSNILSCMNLRDMQC